MIQWGLDCSELASNSKLRYIIEGIMQNSSFNGMSQLIVDAAKGRKIGMLDLVYFCVFHGYFEYLSLMSKYLEKNEDVFVYGIHYQSYLSDDNDAPIILILRKRLPGVKNINSNGETITVDTWLKWLFETSKKINAAIDPSSLNKAMEMCTHGKDSKQNEQLKKMIEKYAQEITNTQK